MKADVLSVEGKKVKSIDLPNQFSEEYRPDLINRAVLAIFSHTRQQYGTFERAGKQQSAKLSRRRHNYKTAYGIGISRSPRKTMWRRGTQFGWVGAFAPFAVGGRRAHPPKFEKVWDEKINKKERRKAIRSALNGTTLKELNNNYNVPFVIENSFENISKTKDVEKIFDSLKLGSEIERCKVKKIRAGVGKLRGRKYKRKIGPLIVVSGECKLLKSAENLAGIDIISVNNLNANLLTRGQSPRLTIYTERAIDRLKNENLFTNEIIHPKQEVKEVKKEVKPKIEKKIEVKKEVKLKIEKPVAKKIEKPKVHKEKVEKKVTKK